MVVQKRLVIRMPFLRESVCGLSSVGSSLLKNEISTNSQCENVWIELKAICKQRSWEMALHFLDFQKKQLSLFHLTEAYEIVLQGCVGSQDVEGGRKVQISIKRDNLQHNKQLNSILLLLYTKCSEMVDAKKVFDMMPEKAIDSWTLMIGAAVKTGHLTVAFELFCQMQTEGIMPNGITCVRLLRACSMTRQVMIVHTFLVSFGIQLNLYLQNTLLYMYCNCGSIENAIYVFIKLPNISEIPWNTLIAGYVHHGLLDKAHELFQLMKLQGGKANEVTFVNVIKVGRCNPYLLKRLHVEICQSGFETNSFVGSALINMYAGFGKMNYACKAFDAVCVRDAPLWNSMLFCFAEYGNPLEALDLCAEMEKCKAVPDKATFLGLLKTCTALRDGANGKKAYSRITQWGFENCEHVGSALVDMYVKCGNLEDAHHVFNRISKHDLVSWNTILAGYCDYEHSNEAFGLFQRMQSTGIKPDRVTFLTILKACANVGALEQCKYFHSCICDDGFLTDVFVGSTLIDTFGKCGSVYHAREVFENMCKRDEVSWSAMIAMYAQHGQAEEAFDIFSQMQLKSIAMDDVTFVAVLTACSHAGLVTEGCEYFELMKNTFGILPTCESCVCMVDLLGRAGQVEKAVIFMQEVDTELTSSVWTALLNASKLSNDVKLAEHALEKIRMLDPQNVSAFVLLSNVYAIAGSSGQQSLCN